MNTNFTLEVEPLINSYDIIQSGQDDVEMWNYCISNLFPISSVENCMGQNVILMTGYPHQGYRIETQMIEGKLNGEATIISPGNITVAEFQYIDNEISGECKLFYKSGELFFEGSLENGYRQGFGIEYDKFKRRLFIGSFEKGNRKNRWKRMDRRNDYWKEVDENENVIAIYKENEREEKEGDMESDLSTKLEKGKTGVKNRRMSMIYRFENGFMTEYKNDVKYYEGVYDFSKEKEYIHKKGKEYDETGNNVIYCGEYLDGKRHGYGISYKNGETEYEGKWVNGFPKRKYITLFIVVPILIAVCVALLILLLPLYTNLKYMLITILLFCELIFFLCGVMNLDDTSTIIRSIEPKLHRNMIKYKDGCLTFADEIKPNAEYFKVNGLNNLNSMIIGSNSFTQLQSGYIWSDRIANNQSKSFYVLNCESLESIQIGEFSFSDFAGQFELSNLKSLKSIQIGTIGWDSKNFYCGSFVIRGMDMILTIE